MVADKNNTHSTFDWNHMLNMDHILIKMYISKEKYEQ